MAKAIAMPNHTIIRDPKTGKVLTVDGEVPLWTSDWQYTYDKRGQPVSVRTYRKPFNTAAEVVRELESKVKGE